MRAAAKCSPRRKVQRPRRCTTLQPEKGRAPAAARAAAPRNPEGRTGALVGRGRWAGAPTEHAGRAVGVLRPRRSTAQATGTGRCQSTALGRRGAQRVPVQVPAPAGARSTAGEAGRRSGAGAANQQAVGRGACTQGAQATAHTCTSGAQRGPALRRPACAKLRGAGRAAAPGTARTGTGGPAPHPQIAQAAAQISRHSNRQQALGRRGTGRPPGRRARSSGGALLARTLQAGQGGAHQAQSLCVVQGAIVHAQCTTRARGAGMCRLFFVLW